MSARVALVPGALALLPEHAGQVDPVAELRAACLDAVRWLGDGAQVIGDAQGVRVGRTLLAEAGVAPATAGTTSRHLVVGNGSARRGEKAPGHLDERSFAFDDALRAALLAGDLAGFDWSLAEELWASVDGLRQAAPLIQGPATVDHDADPYGVQYWVMRWGS